MKKKYGDCGALCTESAFIEMYINEAYERTLRLSRRMAASSYGLAAYDCCGLSLISSKAPHKQLYESSITNVSCGTEEKCKSHGKRCRMPVIRSFSLCSDLDSGIHSADDCSENTVEVSSESKSNQNGLNFQLRKAASSNRIHVSRKKL